MLRRFFVLLLVPVLSACGASGASERPEETPKRVDVSVFRNAVGNGLFATLDVFQPDRALLAAGRARILLVGTVRGFRLVRAGARTSVVMSVRVEEALKGSGLLSGRRVRVDLGRWDNAPGSGRPADEGTVGRYRAAVPEGARFMVQLFPREGGMVGVRDSFKPYGTTSLVFEDEKDGLVGAYADLPETWTRQRSLTGLRDEIFARLRSDGTVCTPSLVYPQEIGEPLRFRFDDCLPGEERSLDRRIRKACQGITMLRPEVHMAEPKADLECLQANIDF